MATRRFLLMLCMVCASASAVAQAQQVPDELSQWVTQDAHVHYTVYHPLHNVRGMSRQVEGYARLDKTGLHLAISSAVTSFFSSDMSRDARLAELVDAAHFPAVIVKGFVPHFVLPQSPAAIEVAITTAVTLHGVGTDVPLNARVTRLAPKTIRVQFSFSDSIEAHGVARPRFMLWPVRDVMQIEGEIDLVAKPIVETQPKDEYSE